MRRVGNAFWKSLSGCLLLLAAVIAVAIASPMKAEAAVTAESGTFGYNKCFTWEYDKETRTTTITGEDDWNSYRLSEYINSNTENVVFKNCYLSKNHFNNFNETFNGMTKLKSVDFSGLTFSEGVEPKNFSGVFAGCTRLEKVTFGDLDVSHVTSFDQMFYGCESLTELDLRGLRVESATSVKDMFKGCENLVSLNVAGWNLSNCESISGLFWGLENLVTLNLDGVETAGVKDMSALFQNCKKLTSLNLGSFDTANTTSMQNMFSGCTELKVLNVRGFDTSKISNGAIFSLAGLDSLEMFTVPKKLGKDVIEMPRDTYFVVNNTVYYSLDASVAGMSLAFVRPDPAEMQVIYRLYNSYSGEHLYTSDANEVRGLVTQHNWTYEGSGWNAPKTGDPVYRLYNASIDDHLYTTDWNEFQTLVGLGWQADNNSQPLFYSGGMEKVYRLYHPGNGRHLLSTDLNEYDALKAHGWEQEGVKVSCIIKGSVDYSYPAN